MTIYPAAATDDKICGAETRGIPQKPGARDQGELTAVVSDTHGAAGITVRTEKVLSRAR